MLPLSCDFLPSLLLSSPIFSSSSFRLFHQSNALYLFVLLWVFTFTTHSTSLSMFSTAIDFTIAVADTDEQNRHTVVCRLMTLRFFFPLYFANLQPFLPFSMCLRPLLLLFFFSFFLSLLLFFYPDSHLTSV